jgi:hypothetical protein
MSMMQCRAQGFGEGIGGIDDARDVAKDDVALGFPFLDGEVLNINMAGSRRWVDWH